MQSPENKHVWSAEEWRLREASLRSRALAARDEAAARNRITAGARQVMRTYTTGFFIVSRFLPPVKRAQVEVIYAAVRYPDEVVDTFPWTPAEKSAQLDEWSKGYETGLAGDTLRACLRAGVPAYLAAFCAVVRKAGIPPEHYRAFLAAMRLDVTPPVYSTLNDLIDRYIYGSAIVVGYFLTHVYGAGTPADLPRALQSARDLGIGLQLTNFVRDVAEDQRRGRLYLPQDYLRAAGLSQRPDARNPDQAEALTRVVKQVAQVAADYYRRAAANLDAFAPDSRVAIWACIEVYGLLNTRILNSPDGCLPQRASVPFREKWRVLPASKWWRIPGAFLRR